MTDKPKQITGTPTLVFLFRLSYCFYSRCRKFLHLDGQNLRLFDLSKTVFCWHMRDMGIVHSHNQDHAVWTGRYWLKDRSREGVPFSIWMRVIDGKLTGTSLEPNVWALIDNEELEATLRGHVADEEIVFLKTYTAFEHEPVYFEGELSDDGSKIVGKWYFGWPNEWTGPFEMKCSAADSAVSKSFASRNKPAQ